MLMLGVVPLGGEYGGEIPQFCDPETGEMFPDERESEADVPESAGSDLNPCDGDFIDVAADGTVTLTAKTVRYADIMVRGAPDNQIYIRNILASGSIDGATGDGEATGTGEGTNQLWSDDEQRPVSGDVSGQIAVVCDDAGLAILGFVSGPGGLLEFEARP